MDSDKAGRQGRVTRVVALAAIALGLAGGSYGVASAASGGSSGSGSSSTGTTTTPTPAAPQGHGGGAPWGHQRSDETLLTGDAKAKVEAAAKAKLSGATIVRVETDADGHAKYEAHVVKADGTPATVYVDASFDVVSVESR